MYSKITYVHSFKFGLGILLHFILTVRTVLYCKNGYFNPVSTEYHVVYPLNDDTLQHPLISIVFFPLHLVHWFSAVKYTK